MLFRSKVVIVVTLNDPVQSEAQQQLKNLGWTGSFNVTTITTFDPTQNNVIAAQSPAPGTQVPDGQSININVYKYAGGGGSSTATSTSCTLPGIGCGG